LKFFAKVVALKISAVLSIPLRTFFCMPFILTFFSATGLLARANTWIWYKPLFAHSTRTLFDVTVGCHVVLLNNSGKQRQREKERRKGKRNRVGFYTGALKSHDTGKVGSGFIARWVNSCPVVTGWALHSN